MHEIAGLQTAQKVFFKNKKYARKVKKSCKKM
jgi:hypothetical protein